MVVIHHIILHDNNLNYVIMCGLTVICSVLFIVGGSGPVEVVKEAQVDIYTNSYCSSFWGRDIDDGNVCAFDPAHGRGACYVCVQTYMI